MEPEDRGAGGWEDRDEGGEGDRGDDCEVTPSVPTSHLKDC